MSGEQEVRFVARKHVSGLSRTGVVEVECVAVPTGRKGWYDIWEVSEREMGLPACDEVFAVDAVWAAQRHVAECEAVNAAVSADELSRL
jgi:hypothetical protein